jgi:hypothetical protein
MVRSEISDRKSPVLIGKEPYPSNRFGQLVACISLYEALSKNAKNA